MPNSNEPRSASGVDRRSEDNAQQVAAAVDEAQRAVNDATRTATDASRRVIERQAEAAVEITRAYTDETLEANRRLVAAWGSGAEAVWRATLDVQQASFMAGSAFLDATARSNRLFMQQWTNGARQALLEPIEILTRATERLLEASAPADRRQR